MGFFEDFFKSPEMAAQMVASVAARRKSVVAAVKWLADAKPEGAAEILRLVKDGHTKYAAKDLPGAASVYDDVLEAVAKARKSPPPAPPPPPAGGPGLKRKKLGADYEGEDKKTGWRAPKLSDKQLTESALAKTLRESVYSKLKPAEFRALLAAKDPQATKLLSALRTALQAGDEATVAKIKKAKISVSEARNRIRESDRVKTKYYSAKQRKKLGLTIGKDGMLYDAEGELFDERKGFVLDPDTGNLYAFDSRQKDKGDGKSETTHHSSPLAGGDVAGAGHIKAKEGRITKIDDASGHYKPDATFTLQTLQHLEKLGAKLVDDRLVDEDGDEVSERKAERYALVQKYEAERKRKTKELLALWKRDVASGAVKAGTPPELPPYDASIAKIRDKLRKKGVGPRQKSTKVKLQGKVGLSQKQFDDAGGDLKKINRTLETMTGQKGLLPSTTSKSVLRSRPALNLTIGEALQRTLTKEQFEQTGGNEKQIRKKDVLNEQIEDAGRKKALAREIKRAGGKNLLGAAGKLLELPPAKLKGVDEELLEEFVLGSRTTKTTAKIKKQVGRREREALELAEAVADAKAKTPAEAIVKLLQLDAGDAKVKKGIAALSTKVMTRILTGEIPSYLAVPMITFDD